MKFASKLSLAMRLSLVVLALIALALSMVTALLYCWPHAYGLALGLSFSIMLPVTIFSVQQVLQPMFALFRAMSGMVISYQDGDYSNGIHWPQQDELASLVQAHNQLG
ncbi:MAG: ATP-binding protein, partial [Burkholderiales bacterium]|nr:ATP-binding protein [Burkholderiales bacterium]